MNRARRVRSFAWIVLLAAVVVGCGKKVDPTDEALRLLAPETSILLAVHLPSIAGTEAFRAMEEELLTNREIGEPLRATGKPLSELVDWFYLGATDAPNPQALESSAGIVTLLKTSLKDDFLQQAMTRSSNPFASEKVEGVVVWTSEDAPKVGLAQLKGGYILMGAAEDVRNAVRRSKKKIAGLTSTSPLFEGAGDVNRGGALWAVVRMTPTVSAQLGANPITAGLNSVHHLALSGTMEEAETLNATVRASCNSQDDAIQLETTLRSLIGFMAFGGSNPEVAEMVSSATIETRGDLVEVKAKLPFSLLTGALRMTE